MMIRLADVHKHYGTGGGMIRALDGVTLSVERGEFSVITGPSGSGKTTLLNLVGGMTRPNSGVVEVAGQSLTDMPDAELSRFRSATIGFTFQFQSMLPALNALDNVRLPLTFIGEKDEGRAMRLLECVGLADRASAFSRELSAGQQRRVCIARALINGPSLLLCDEPTGDLDPDNETAIMDIILKANKDGTTVLMTTHNHALRSYTTRSLNIRRGRIEDEDFGS